jgi:DNA mismatch repair ATPase MutS
MSWSPFHTITSALEHEGTIGVASTFEAEIEFAKSVLQPSIGSAFVMMDEIFHSTNAHDGLVASRIFLEKLYVKPNTISVISTHFKELAEQYIKTAQCLQMEATVNDDTSLRYSYKAVNGISDISSVMEILKEKGLAE